VKVDTSRVVVVVVTVEKLKIYLVDVEVVGTVEIITGTWLEVGRNMAWYTRVVVVVEWEPFLETNTQGTIQRVMVVLEDTADAVVRVLFFSKRTLRLRTVRIPPWSRSGTRVDEVYHPLSKIRDRKLTGSLLSIVRPCRRISYQPIGTPTQLVVLVTLCGQHKGHTLYRNAPMEEHLTFFT